MMCFIQGILIYNSNVSLKFTFSLPGDSEVMVSDLAGADAFCMADLRLCCLSGYGQRDSEVRTN